ncbi:MAG: hypothetical protein SF182_17490 [Deltaproteobacteria bacterium]|nr:hypothetical protein [Deltaproteobacteria bacterium]
MRLTMSRKLPTTTTRLIIAVSCASALCFFALPAWSAMPAWRLAEVRGGDLGCLRERREDELALFACAATCAPIPWQLDERDATGRWALDSGPEPNPDDAPQRLDDNDAVLWMAADGGRRAVLDELPPVAGCAVEIGAAQGDETRWVYALALPAPAPRSPLRYVDYDAARDLVFGERLALGFGAPTPRYLALRSPAGALGPNLLDRLKVRASARFFGLIPLGRDEDDIEWRFGAWRAGPIRVLRREYQWVRLGFGLRTPIFETESLITRNTIELPVRLRLNFPPTYFFSHIEVQAVLDFRDLHGWRVAAADMPPRAVGVGGDGLDGRRSDWIGLVGDDVTFVLELVLGESLRSLAPTLVYREQSDGPAPEEQMGEMPGIGFRLTEWSAIDRGTHGFAAVAYALPAGTPPDAVARERAAPLQLIVNTLHRH